MSLRVCAQPGCPVLIPKGKQGRCPEHARAADRARGTPAERGYDATHRRLRKRWSELIAEGQRVQCVRCDEQIRQGDDWQLDHLDDRSGWRGPAHQLCNLSAAGKRSHE